MTAILCSTFQISALSITDFLGYFVNVQETTYYRDGCVTKTNGIIVRQGQGNTSLINDNFVDIPNFIATTQLSENGTNELVCDSNFLDHIDIATDSATLIAQLQKNTAYASGNKPMCTMLKAAFKGNDLNVEGSSNVTIGTLGTKTSRTNLKQCGNSNTTTSVIKGSTVNINKSGNSNLRIGSVEAAQTINITASGTGNIKLSSLLSKMLNIKKSGNVSIDVAGMVDKHNVNISGNGNYDSKKLYSKLCALEVSGTGKHIFNVSDRIYGNVRDVSDVKYTGTATNSVKTSYLGSCKHI